MRWSSAQPYRTSNAETNYAFFQLIPLAQIPAGFSCGAGGFHDARNIHPPAHAEGKERPVKTQTSYRTIR